MNSGFKMEVEEVGLVALIGLVLAPGVVWIAKGNTVGSKLFRAAVVGILVACVAKVEISLDTTADGVGDLLDGDKA